MNLEDATLSEVAAIVYRCLRESGIEAVVVGGSAITVHVPDVYTSSDIDLALISGFNRSRAARALEDLGFQERGRDFVHPKSAFSIDLVAQTPYIDQRPIREFCTLETNAGPLRAYYLEDAIGDRVSAWVHWSDSESLKVAERALEPTRNRIDRKRLVTALDSIETGDRPSKDRLDLARAKLSTIIGIGM